MSIERLRWLLAALVVAGALLLVWTLVATRSQCHLVQEALVRQASVLARTLAPGLTTSEKAAHDLDEMIRWKILDNARLLAEMGATPSPDRLADLALANGLDGAALYGPGGRVEATVGDLDRTEAERAFDALKDRDATHRILESTDSAGVEHLAAIVEGSQGTAGLARVHASTATSRVESLGVRHLLEELVGTGSILYLELRTTEGAFTTASWDDGPIPANVRPEVLATLRGRPVFEVSLPLSGQSADGSRLRVGLDGEPLLRSANASRSRGLLVVTLLLAFLLASGGAAWLSSVRIREREEARKRIAEAEADRRRSDRLAAAGALTAGLAHEVRSPLNAIGLAAQRLERRLDTDDASHEISGRIRREVLRLEGVLRSFLELARPIGEDLEILDLGRLAADQADLLRDEARDLELDLSTDLETVEIRGDRSSLSRAVINLLRNAFQASSPGASVELRVMADGPGAVLRVSDRGRGLPDDLRERVFDAFVSSRPDGTGLGLPLVRRVAEAHGGTVSVGNRRGGGVEAVLRLPGGDPS